MSDRRFEEAYHTARLSDENKIHGFSRVKSLVAGQDRSG